MLSSIFNFKKLDYPKAIFLLLISIVFYLILLESITFFGMKTVNKTAKRMHEDYRKVLQIDHNRGDQKPPLLLVGNSLLLLGVDRNKLTDGLSSKYTITFWPIENTGYLDWYFGLRRIFAEGSRPSYVILCLSMSQLTSKSLNSENFAYYMMDLNDLFLVKQAADLNVNTVGNYFFANFSSWLGNRWGIRNWIMEAWLPNADLLAKAFIPRAAQNIKRDDNLLLELSKTRLQALLDLCKAHRAKFLFLIPPTLNKGSSLEATIAAARQANIPVLVPYSPGELSKDHFSDGFHLNQKGALVFTQRLTSVLKEID
ncbi:MAG: hypothetical protein WBE39_13080 [Candidatus Competibacter sp.]